MRNNRNGFTYIEVILYVAIVGIFITGVVTFGWDIIGIRVKSRVEQEVIDNVRTVVKRVSFEVRNASGINSASGSNLSLSNDDPVRDPTVFSLSGGRVLIGWGGSGDCPVSSPCFLTSADVNVTGLAFTDLSDTGGKSANVIFEVSAQSVVSGQKDWWYQMSEQSAAEVRSF